MHWVRKSLSFLISQMAYKFAFGQIRQRALLVYLKALQAARRSLMTAMALFFVLQLMVLGFIGTLVTAIWLWPTDTETKLFTLLGIFGACFLIPLIALLFFFSERLWFKASGADQLLKGDA
jgi:hypothetical protein